MKDTTRANHGDQIGETVNVDDINIKQEYDGTVSVRETMDVDVKITALGPAGQIINLDNINYNVQSAEDTHGIPRSCVQLII